MRTLLDSDSRRARLVVTLACAACASALAGCVAPTPAGTETAVGPSSATRAAPAESGNPAAVGDASTPAVAAAKVGTSGHRHYVREVRSETTPDGRSIRVVYETEVDAQGRPLGPARPVRY